MNKWIKIALWSLFGILTLLLLSFAIKTQKTLEVPAPEINIVEQKGMSFLTKDELLTKLRRANLYSNELKFEDLKIDSIENFILKMNVVESAQVYKNIGQKWNIDIKVRRPIVRVLPEDNSGYYIDDKGKIMQVSHFPAHVLVATGLDNSSALDLDISTIINNDSLITIKKTDDLYRISSYVCSNTFFSALLTQIHYDKKDGFILIPRVGQNKIIFGLAPNDEEVKEKFEKLRLFYEEAIPHVGWGTYKTIDLRFEKQIVGKKN